MRESLPLISERADDIAVSVTQLEQVVLTPGRTRTPAETAFTAINGDVIECEVLPRNLHFCSSEA
jgi:hypothetical protein